MKNKDMENLIKKSCLQLAKELIEIKYLVEIISIDFEDGSGKKYIVTTKDNPLKKQFIRL